MCTMSTQPFQIENCFAAVPSIRCLARSKDFSEIELPGWHVKFRTWMLLRQQPLVQQGEERAFALFASRWFVSGSATKNRRTKWRALALGLSVTAPRNSTKVLSPTADYHHGGELRTLSTPANASTIHTRRPGNSQILLTCPRLPPSAVKRRFSFAYRLAPKSSFLLACSLLDQAHGRARLTIAPRPNL